MKPKHLIMMLACALLFNACGGGGGGGGVDPGMFVLLSTQMTATKNGKTIVANYSEEDSYLGVKDGHIAVLSIRPQVVGGEVSINNDQPEWGQEVVDFTKDDKQKSTAYGNYFQKTHSTRADLAGGGTFVSEEVDLLVLGGKKAGLKYADFGYWESVTTVTARDSANAVVSGLNKAKIATVDYFVMADPSKYAENIVLDSKATYRGNVLGQVYLQKQGDTKNIYNRQELTGGITLTADFGASNKITADMSTYRDGNKWYDFRFTSSVSNLDKVNGEFTMDSVSVTNSVAVKNQGGYNMVNPTGGLSGFFLGDDGVTPEEAAGGFDIIGSGYTLDLDRGGVFKPIVEGVFGAKK
ncbi:hypothetical protein Dip518_001234 [Parelusimicrobium proximum]|uniref:hypothetical protein n=1 Tax=Parelusimicrobium proximum TaxID=3228953 RepID=UPI003D16D336